MKHCICVIEESVIGVGLYNFYVYTKTPKYNNDLPTLPDSLNSEMLIKGTQLELLAHDYKLVGEALPGTGIVVPSLAEFVLNEFWAVDYLFYDPQGKFIRRQLYEMQLGAILKTKTTPIELTESMPCGLCEDYHDTGKGYHCGKCDCCKESERLKEKVS